MDPILERYHALEEKVASYTPNLDTQRLFSAFTYADAAHNGQLVATLEAFAAYGCNVARTAEALGQHQNTVRYRLDAIGRLTGLSPRDPADMEQLDVALRLARIESGR